MQSKRKKNLGLAAVAVVVLAVSTAVLLGWRSRADDHTVADRLVAQIDRCTAPGACSVSLGLATDFAWDRVVVFEVGSSREQISRALGAKYDGATDLVNGIVFSRDGAVVHEETQLSDPERPAKLKYRLLRAAPGTHSVGYERGAERFRGAKTRVDGVDYYTLQAL